MRSQLSALAAMTLLVVGTGLAQEANTSPRECVPSDSSTVDGKLAGYVLYDSDVAVPAARTVLESAIEGPEPPATGRAATTTDAGGRFWFCDVPLAARVTLRAEGPEGRVATASLVMPEGFARQDLTLPKGPTVGGGGGDLAVVILDAETGQPVDGAILRIPDADREALVDARGRASLSGLPAGTHEFEVLHIAYGEQGDELEVRHGHTHVVEIHLTPRALVMEPIRVTVEYRPEWLVKTGFYWRQEKGLGHHVSPTEIERRNPARFSHLLETAPGVRLVRVCNPYCNTVLRTDATRRRQCSPEIYMDGRKLRLPGLFSLDDVPVWDVAAVEMYTRISQTPAEFYGLCGSLVIWTKRGER